jgi:outer membrane receptor protein involved in Fe transport
VRSGNWFSAALNADFHRDEYGLPGPVSEAAFLGSDADRRQTNFPLDGGETDDERLRVTIELGTDETGVLRAVGMNRKRENPFVIDERSGEIREDSDRIDLKYQRDIDLLNRDHTVFLGVVSDQADYARRLGETDAVGTITKRGDVRHEAWFAAADITLAGPLQLSLGYRGDSFRLRLNDSEISDDICDDQVVFPGPAGDVTFCNDPGGARMGEVFSPAQDSWRNDAFEAGLVYSTAAETHWFLSYASSFRNPNIDELALSDAALGPQAGKHWDAGIRRLLGDTFELSLALFVVETKAEILFAIDKELSTDVFIGRNFNAGELTERRGGEVDVRWYATGSLTLTANAGYTRAEFKGSGATLPLVPRWTGGLSAQYVFAYDFTLTVTGNYVGTRYDGNDFSNAGSKLDAYKVVDAKLVWARDALSLSVGVANLFNEVYATSVYSSSYYPLPARNFYAGISYRFSALG